MEISAKIRNRNQKLRQFFENKKALIGVIIIVLQIILCFIVPVFLDSNPNLTDSIGGFNQSPSKTHILGTDAVGRDLLSRVLHGGRVSLLVGFAATFITIIIGVPLGLLAGYYGGKIGDLIMRTADIFLSFPSMILILVLVSVIGPSITTIIFVLGILNWPQVGKLIYGNTLSEKNKEYVLASKAIGTNDFSIVVQEILPNVISPVWSLIAFRIGGAILMESSLSFLGAGVQPPMSSWGNIIYEAQNLMVLTARPWVWIPPGIMVVLTVISFNFIGERIRDVLDPKINK